MPNFLPIFSKELLRHFLQQNNLIEAEKHYKRILTVMPDNALVLNNLAWAFIPTAVKPFEVALT
jgi:Tfp pilus assembly protein PilF